jgi:hypothetical protein
MIQISCQGENLPGVSGADGGNVHRYRFLHEYVVAAYSLSLLMLLMKTLDPLRSGDNGTFWCRILPEGAILDPTVCLSVSGGLLALAVKLPGGDACLGGVQCLLARRLEL